MDLSKAVWAANSSTKHQLIRQFFPVNFIVSDGLFVAEEIAEAKITGLKNCDVARKSQRILVQIQRSSRLSFTCVSPISLATERGSKNLSLPEKSSGRDS